MLFGLDIIPFVCGGDGALNPVWLEDLSPLSTISSTPIGWFSSSYYGICLTRSTTTPAWSFDLPLALVLIIGNVTIISCTGKTWIHVWSLVLPLLYANDFFLLILFFSFAERASVISWVLENSHNILNCIKLKNRLHYLKNSIRTTIGTSEAGITITEILNKQLLLYICFMSF